jgi:hypothetical protein
MAAEAEAILLRQSAIVILARRAAMREVKRRRQKAGLRETLPHSTLARLAIEHLQAHPHLLAEAAADPLVQILELTHRRGTADPKRELLCRNQVQNGGRG